MKDQILNARKSFTLTGDVYLELGGVHVGRGLGVLRGGLVRGGGRGGLRGSPLARLALQRCVVQLPRGRHRRQRPRHTLCGGTRGQSRQFSKLSFTSLRLV